MQDIAPPEAPHSPAEPASHAEAERFSLRRAHDALWVRLWPLLGVLFPIAFILDLPLRWFASLGDLLAHWWIGFVKALRSERGYLTAGTIVAVYLAIFGLIDNKSTQEETRASVERSLFMTLVSSGSAASFVAAMKDFGPTQTILATEHPSWFKFWDWGRTYQPNREPMRLWAQWRLNLCEKETKDCSSGNDTRIDLSFADLRGTDLRGANVFGADLRDADLTGAILIGANLIGVNLNGANLRDANLRRADLNVAILRDAFLSNADLREADLNSANLSRANLSRANLSSADLILAHLSGAKYDGGTKFPDGFDPKAAGMELVPE